jgi:hypothetical protein
LYGKLAFLLRDIPFERFQSVFLAESAPELIHDFAQPDRT